MYLCPEKAFEQKVATWVALEKHPNIVRRFHMDIPDNQLVRGVPGSDNRNHIVSCRFKKCVCKQPDQ